MNNLHMNISITIKFEFNIDIRSIIFIETVFFIILDFLEVKQGEGCNFICNL